MATKETVKTVRDLESDKYKYGFVTDVEQERAAKGLTEETVRFISAKKNEPLFMLDWRLRALERWQTMKEPHWGKVQYPPIDYQAISYYSAPKLNKDGPKSLDEVDARSVRKKMKDKAFAKSIIREDIVNGAAGMGVELDEHITFTIEAMKPVAAELGLAGS